MGLICLLFLVFLSVTLMVRVEVNGKLNIGVKPQGNYMPVCIYMNNIECEIKMILLTHFSFQKWKLSYSEPQQEGQSCGGHMGPYGKCAPGLKCICKTETLSGRSGCGECVKSGRPRCLGCSN